MTIIRIINTQRKLRIDQKRICRIANHILNAKGNQKIEVSILFCGKKLIRTLNKRFRKVDRCTDVLAFNMREGKGAPLHPEILGDVVICPEVCQGFGRIHHHPAQKEIDFCLVHGILHLLGFDDTTRQRRLLMEKEQTRIFESISKA